MKMEDRVYKTVVENNLLSEGDTVIVGASGGPDSQFLIHILDKLKNKLGIDIVLAHLNHLHRKEASKDEDLVRQTAEKLGLKFYSRSRSMDELAKELKISSEDAGRRLRYEFFNDLSKKFPISKIAVAHNKDDQAETALMRIIRGTGLDGLRAMDYKNGNIIRPILNIKKKEILAYLDSNEIAYAIDHTNFENDYTRNKIRLDIIPILEEINPNVVDAVFKLSDLARDDLAILEKSVDSKFDEMSKVKHGKIYFDKDHFEKTDPALLRRILRKAVGVLKGEIKDLSKENLDDFLKIKNLATGKSLIKDDISLRKSYEAYVLEILTPAEKSKTDLYLYDKDQVHFDGIYLKTSIINSGKYEKNKNVGYFDYDLLHFPLKVRTRRAGDRFVPLGHKSEKKLKDFFIDQKIDRKKRDELPIILSDDKIIWLASLRISDEFKVTGGTKKILKIEVYDEN
ncbi:tRNA(Ile)-lysidine synthetase [Anaerococcus lactolyticus ATCC 51172]|uniref:tRNA(Ile)-lysidine synthase n=1 Tax=Anaerococcus lactolyticus ATCC 51172 TaxID=525254 RepID=C2BHQ0_9FIRM|nr:tRNA lysidine(34) synthetase TilS [Anaerococcus lactolyticus]EEI85663.1 tRNA(Ile)-lysidine synthetase [Anaerococcus lactolyticus ATCC 51172]